MTDGGATNRFLSIREALALPEGREVFSQTPWALTGGFQLHSALEKALLNEAERLREIATRQAPHFQIIVKLVDEKLSQTPATSVDHRLNSLIASCLLQTWPSWTLHIINGHDDLKRWTNLDGRIKVVDTQEIFQDGFVLNLPVDGILHPQILGLLARESLTHPKKTLLYCNEIELTSDRHKIAGFFSKPDFDLPTLERADILGAMVAIDAKILNSADVDGKATAHDRMLQLAAMPEFDALHIPAFGYLSERSEPLKLRSLARLLTATAKIAVLIPYRDEIAMTLRCLDSLEEQKGEIELEIHLGDNRSQDLATATALKAWLEHKSQKKKHQYKLHTLPGAFNYGRLNNQMAAQVSSDCEFILVLNNDVILSDQHMIATLAGELQKHSSLAVVGPRLMFADGRTVQHGGVRILPALRGLGFHSTGHRVRAFDFVYTEHSVASVTFACALIRRTVWRELKGIDELYFANGFSDADFCLRAREHGYGIFYLGTVAATHLESKSRGATDEHLEEIIFTQRHAASLSKLLRQDFSPVFPLDGEGKAEAFEVPLRYRLVDGINETVKKAARPLHHWLKKSLFS